MLTLLRFPAPRLHYAQTQITSTLRGDGEFRSDGTETEADMSTTNMSAVENKLLSENGLADFSEKNATYLSSVLTNLDL